MFHLLYKTICTVTGRYYIGIHSTEDVDDGYLGSGLLLRRSVKRYGREAHVREILGSFKTRREASDAERSIVTWQLIEEDRLCMNICQGGEGGDTLSRHPNKEAIYASFSRAGEANGMFGRQHSTASIELMRINRRGTPAWNKGIARTEEESRKIVEGTKAAMARPDVRARFLASRAKAAKENTGKITIWKNGKKRIIWPKDFNQVLVNEGWVRTKAASLSVSSRDELLRVQQGALAT